MDKVYVIKSQNDNCYFVDIENKVIQLTHPYMIKCYYENTMCDNNESYYVDKLNYWKKYSVLQNEDIVYEQKCIDKYFVENCFLNTSQIVFEVTEQCNLHCKYCAYGELYDNYDPRKKRSASFENSKLFLDYYFEKCREHNLYNKRLIIGFYGGEPLVSFDFIKAVVEYVKSVYSVNNDLVAYNITTNGVLLDKYISYFVENEFNLLISLDGDEYASSYRIDHNNRSVFNKVVCNIDLVRNKYPDYYKRNVNFNAVLHDRNSTDLILRYFRECFDKIPSISPLNPTGVNEDNRVEYERMNNLDLIQDYNIYMWNGYVQLTPVVFSHAKFVNQYKYSTYYDYLDLLSEDSDRTIIPTGTCLPFGKKIYVTVAGKILPCERVGHGVLLGEIKEDNIDIDFDKISKKYTGMYHEMLVGQCCSCQLINNCTSCIFHLNDKRCSSYMDKNAMEIYLSDKLNFMENNVDILSVIDKINIKY